MSSISISQKIESLPPLPKTILDIEQFRKKEQKDILELLEIIEKDALIISTLLKISNSAMFGFRSKVETPARAVNLLGINFTISIAIGGTIQNLLMTSLEPYGVSTDDFMKTSNISSNLASLWLSKFDDKTLKEELLLPSLLQETGKFIFADILKNENRIQEFKNRLNDDDISVIEKEFFGLTTSELTAQIFKHWKLSDKLINIIEYVDNLDKCEKEYKQKAQILNVIKTACCIQNPLSDKSIQKALEKASKYGLDISSLKKAIETLQDRLLDEK